MLNICIFSVIKMKKEIKVKDSSTIRHNAVESFLLSLDANLPIGAHLANCLKDAKSYNWNGATVCAIMDRIIKRYEKKKYE